MIVGHSISLRSVTASMRRANLVFLLLSLVVTVAYLRFGVKRLAMSSTPFTILGAALTIFLSFRTNSAYDRWWEARTLWGGIVNQSRTLVRQMQTFLPADAGKGPVREMAYLQMAWVNATRAHLRKQDASAAALPFLPTEFANTLTAGVHIPVALLTRMGLLARRALEAGHIDTIQFTAIDATLTELTNLIGGCERIKNTPLPRQYDTVPALAIYAYSTLLPLGLVSTLNWWTPLICALITSIFIAIDSIGSNIEDPFENTIHDTPMSALCRTIEINLRQMIGETELPKPLEPKHGILL